MPRYFFHVRDGVSPEDEEGVELPGLEEARAEAVRTAGEMLRDNAERFRSGAEWMMDVTDEGHRTVFSVRLTGHDGRWGADS